MPHRKVAQHELASFLSLLAHPLRLAIVFALKDGERDVSTLVGLTGAPQTTVSQSMGRLRLARLVRERRVGRHVFYALTLPELPQWLDGGLALLIAETEQVAIVHKAISTARRQMGTALKQTPARAPTTKTRRRSS